jgi:WD40 repeat protein
MSLDYSPTGDVIASSGSDRYIKFWNVTNGTEIKTTTIEHTS